MIDKDEFTNGASSDAKGLLTRALGGCPSGPTEEELWAIKSEDEQAVRQIIRTYTKPLFLEVKAEHLSGEDKGNFYERWKEGLRFLINLNDDEAFDWIGNVGQFFLYPDPNCPNPQFRHGPDYRTFYLWIWEELCGDEDWRIADMEVYLQNTDPYANLELDENGQWIPKST